MKENVRSLLEEIGQDEPICGFYIGDGWFPHVARALREMAAVSGGWRLTQVKSKFCTLRIYYDLDKSVSEEEANAIHKIVRWAESNCDIACEFCGALVGGGPMSGTKLCTDCLQKDVYHDMRKRKG